jgi:hypothetical protein
VGSDMIDWAFPEGVTLGNRRETWESARKPPEKPLSIWVLPSPFCKLGLHSGRKVRYSEILPSLVVCQ